MPRYMRQSKVAEPGYIRRAEPTLPKDLADRRLIPHKWRNTVCGNYSLVACFHIDSVRCILHEGYRPILSMALGSRASDDRTNRNSLASCFQLACAIATSPLWARCSQLAASWLMVAKPKVNKIDFRLCAVRTRASMSDAAHAL